MRNHWNDDIRAAFHPEATSVETRNGLRALTELTEYAANAEQTLSVLVEKLESTDFWRQRATQLLRSADND